MDQGNVLTYFKKIDDKIDYLADRLYPYLLMRSILKILLLLNVFLAGCIKETSFEKQKGFYISCTIDGIPTTYIALAAGDRTDPGNGIISMYAVLDRATDNDFFGLTVSSVNLSKAVTAGEYTDADTDFRVYSGFGDLTRRINYNAGSSLVVLARSGGINISNHLKVTITELRYRTIRGTFSGDFYEQMDPRGIIKKVTDGSFYVRMN
jgi:hypothetical protein